jgi:hypothetical protein
MAPPGEQVLAALRGLSVEETTPLEALQLLARWKGELEGAG